jgi:hypothetical protein
MRASMRVLAREREGEGVRTHRSHWWVSRCASIRQTVNNQQPTNVAAICVQPPPSRRENATQFHVAGVGSQNERSSSHIRAQSTTTK